MICISPINLKNDNRKLSTDYRTNQVPCGRCLPCLKKRQSTWCFRLQSELESAQSGAFLTLTYDNDNLPLNNGLATLKKRDFQLFMKRLRKKVSKTYGQENPIKYYACGEYGSNTLRPHYHAIMFNLPKDYILRPQIIADIWSCGHITMDSPDPAAIAYVTKYIMKQEKWNKELLANREPEFQLQSKGLGKNYLSDKMIEYYKKQLTPYLFDKYGNPYPMPRYYKDKIYNDEEKIIVNNKALDYIEQNKQPLEKEHLTKQKIIRKHQKIQREERRKI